MHKYIRQTDTLSRVLQNSLQPRVAADENCAMFAGSYAHAACRCAAVAAAA
jgi:hypothetical protein